MKIVLANQNTGSEHSFEEAVIRIGRNAVECQIVFDQSLFPMVSRHHAEICVQNGKWVLLDSNSSYGTYLNGQKVVKPEPIQIASKIQFGTDGPIFIVLWHEVSTEVPKPKLISEPVSFGNIKPPITIQPPKIPSNPMSNFSVHLDFASGDRQPFVISKTSVLLGRSPECDIVFDDKAIMVSRKHAEISLKDRSVIITDNGSFNGTYVNGNRIVAPTEIYHTDEIQIGTKGPVLRLNSPKLVAPKRKPAEKKVEQNIEIEASKTMVFNADSVLPKSSNVETQLISSYDFGSKSQLTIGRDVSNDITLDGLQISNRHATINKTNNGITIDDSGSTNGIFLNGNRISRSQVSVGDSVQIGSFVLRIDKNGKVGVFDTRSQVKIDAVNITKEVKNRSGSGKLRILDSVSLSIQPNEFVGLLGPSGAGKSTFMDALNGMRPATSGNVLVNDLDLYRHLDSLKQSIGYVPQDDIIHRELTVYRTLYYVAKLRLSNDVSTNEINGIITEVLDVTGLSERRDVPINQLSGGQRKRVSIAVELITKPSVIFLDEPTSGLDPATEEKIMKLFRQIAESGRTVILTTHAMENVKLFDKIVVLMRGKLVFYGKPDEALKYLKAKSFKELYDKLEEPVETEVRAQGEAQRRIISEKVAENWKQKFLKTAEYQRNVFEPLKDVGQKQSAGLKKKNRLGIFGSIRQTIMLSRRYFEVLLRDKFNLFILLIQAPVIAILTAFVMDSNKPRDFVFFVLSLVAVWFGTSVAAREIIRERPIYNRERMINLGLLPYLVSKLFVLGVIVSVQCLLVFVPLKLLDLIGLMSMPGELGGIPQFWAMILTAGVGIGIGLLISAIVKTSEMATSLVPLILIPQILFSGLVGVPNGISKVASLTMPAAWSFDTMKRFSTLDTLEPEGASENDKTKGLGLYKYIEKQNDRIIEESRQEIDKFREEAADKVRESMAKGELPNIGDPPKPADAMKIPTDLSGYVSFLHPWMHEILNQIVLMIMFFGLVLLILIVLRFKDIK
jgi:ABC transport system ATP-binding/permease protein